ncbi:MAG: radical SAM protein [Pseudomonadota bacterium]
MPDPFSRIPFSIEGGFHVEPSSFETPVAVLGTAGWARPMLLRTARACGLACDRAGRVSAAYVIATGAGGVACRRSGGRLVFSLSAATPVGSHSPPELEKIFSSAIASAQEVSREELERAPASCFDVEEKPARDRGIKALVFENLFRDPDSPADMENLFTCGSFQLASSLRAWGHDVLALPGRLDSEQVFTRPDLLDEAFSCGRPDLVCITLLEACFDKTRALINLIKSKSDALIAVGGPAATFAPEHAAAHLEGADLIVRGDGEEAVCLVADLCGMLREAGGLTRSILDRVLSLDGVLLLGPGFLAAGHPGRVNRAASLDGCAFDVTLLEKRHVTGGLSLETARGCVHPCAFCTAPSRGLFRGRSAKAMELRLRAYGERIGELWSGGPQASAQRIHFADDDFSCDPGRAAEILGAVRRSGFQLSSFQASVRDFFTRDRGEWKVNREFIEALSPDLFQDAPLAGELERRPPAGMREKRFNSFVKLGVESFCDEELRRMGKGYTVERVRELIAMLDERGIVHDAYFICANRQTRINDIVTSLIEIAGLKIRHPHTFFIRFPIVPYLVTTFVAPGFRKWLSEKEKKRGAPGGPDTGDLEIEGWLKAEGYPEYDYPLVKRDMPSDPEAIYAADNLKTIFEPDGMYIKPLENLHAGLKQRLASIEASSGGLSPRASDARLAVRRLSSAARLVVYDGIRQSRERKLPKRVGARVRAAARLFGSAGGIVSEVRRHIEVGDPRLVLIPTRDCSLRCRYCPMTKEEGKLMSIETAVRALELLLSSTRPSVILQFFGGEALLRRDFVLEVMARAQAMAARAGKKLGFIISTNGVSLDRELIGLFRAMPVKVEVSIDGTREVQLANRVGRDPAVNSYDLIRAVTPALLESSIPHDAIMVVTPGTVGRLLESFAHVVDLGYRKVQVNHALGVRWTDEKKKLFAGQLFGIEKKFFGRSARPNGIEFVDLWSLRRPMLLNCEITVDFDGAIYFGNGFLVSSSTPGAFDAGRLDELESFDAYSVRRPDNDYLLEHTYPEGITKNNLQVGRIFASFVRHIREKFPDEFAAMKPTRAPMAKKPQPPGQGRL